MLIHVVARPLADLSHVPSSGVSHLAENIRRAGGVVVEDVSPATGGVPDAVARCAEQLRARWARQQPQVVHAFGLVATLSALAARPPGLPVVSTFDVAETTSETERRLAQQVDGVIALSTAEQEHWRRVGVRMLTAGALPVAGPATSTSPVPSGGHAVCLSTGPELEAVVRSMPHWAPSRLILLGRLSAGTRAAVRRLADRLGVGDRIEHRPGLRGELRAQVWRQASVLIAGAEGARHGAYVLEAAAHGVPAVAVAADAHLDHVVPGATGVLVHRLDDARGLGHAVATLLKDPLNCRGLGSAALVRVRCLHELPVAGHRLLSVYHEVAGIHEQSAADPGKTVPLTQEGTRLALEYLPLARQLAHRYAGRGQRLEDLVQVASLGLVRAASRFDPDFGSEFHSFAVPTILGELRRHFRDHAWTARVPRSLQEATMKVQRVSDELRASRGHEVTPAEIAEELGLVEEEVLQAQQARGEAMTSMSLDHPMGEDGDEAFGDLVGGADPDLEYVELREAARSALRQVPEREREILQMRFYGDRTQAEIAQQLGLSQVHVSRLITRTLTALREHVVNDAPLPESWQGADGEQEAAQRRAA